MNKKSLTERDICSKLITTAIQKAGWDLQIQIRDEVTFTQGRVMVHGKLHSIAYILNDVFAPYIGIKVRNYNLDCKNPHVGQQEVHAPEEILALYASMQQEISDLRKKLKDILNQAFQGAA